MSGFLTPYEMFEEYMDKEARAQHSLQRTMNEYARKAEDKIGEYVECIAEAYINGYERAYDIFQDCGLKMIHAFAVLEDEEAFDEEFRETEMSYGDLDEE